MKSTIATLLLLSKDTLASTGWGYDDMAAWSDDYSMCDNEDESPIDIITDDAIYNDDICSAQFDWDVDYTQQTFKISNNGHSIVLQPVESSNIDPDHELDTTLWDEEGSEFVSLSENENTIATFPNYFQPFGSEHDSFCLHSLHFHWGNSDEFGSEHLVNGHQYALEVHFVHYSCAHADLTATLSAFGTEEEVSALEEAGEDTHQLGVVGIFFDVREDESNPVFDTIFAHLDDFELPAEDGDAANVVSDIDLSELIPEDIATAGYYAYEGSLTTPPCTNIVRWHVMNARSWIGASQMEQFRELLSEEDHHIAPNYREVQHNVNNVYACMGEGVVGHDDVAIAENESVEDDATARLIVWMVAVVAIITPIVLGVVCCYQAKKEKEEAEAQQQKK